MSPDPVADLVHLRAIALALPGAGEKRSHGTACFYLAPKGRSFAWFWHDHHGDGRTAVLVKTSGADEQAQLEEADPDPLLSAALSRPLGLDRHPRRRAHARLGPCRSPRSGELAYGRASQAAR